MADTDETLLSKINAAVAAHNTAEQAVTTARDELVSKSRAVGQLLLEGKKLHPKVKDFEAFLKRVQGLSLSRAYDCMRIAGGRTTDEELREEARERVRKQRAKKKLPKPEPVSVTGADVTESPKRITQSPEISAEERREQNAALDTETPDLSIPPFLDRTNDGPTSLEDWDCAEFRREQDVAWSRSNLKEFIRYCRVKLPTITTRGIRHRMSISQHGRRAERRATVQASVGQCPMRPAFSDSRNHNEPARST